jgi:hypothetical protein
MVRLKYEAQISTNVKIPLAVRLRSSCGMCFGSKVIETLFEIYNNK